MQNAQTETNGGGGDVTVRAEFDRMAGQFKAALPSHIPVERFIRIVLTSVNSNQDLLRVAQTLEGRRSLFESATKAAQDGLLPDGREGAFVVYNTNVAKANQPKRYVELIRWMPMVGGICKKVRNSGEIVMIDAVVVHEKDSYDSWTDEAGPHFKYKRVRGDRGKPVLTFAYARTKEAGTFLEEMDEADMDAIRSVSKAANSGPWAGPFSNEMRRKSALRRLAKYRLPSSADVDEVIRRDDDLYDFNALDEQPKIDMPKRKSEAERIDGGGQQQIDGDEQEPDPKEPTPTEVRAAEIERWVKEATDDEIKAKTATQFTKDCVGLTSEQVTMLCALFNNRKFKK